MVLYLGDWGGWLAGWLVLCDLFLCARAPMAMAIPLPMPMPCHATPILFPDGHLESAGRSLSMSDGGSTYRAGQGRTGQSRVEQSSSITCLMLARSGM